MFSGYVKTRESPYIQVTIWVNTIPSHIDTRAILSRYKGSYMLYEDGFQMVSKIYIYTPSNIHTLLVLKKMRNLDCRYPNGIMKR